MIVSSIFARHLLAVDALHASLKSQLKSLETLFDQVKTEKGLTLFDVMLSGTKLRHFEDIKDLEAYRTSMLKALENGDHDMPKVNQYGVFDHTEISTLKASYRFLQSIWDDGALAWVWTDCCPYPENLEMLSMSMIAPSTLLVLKYYWMHLDYDNTREFDGILSNTKPVRVALKQMYGTDFGSPYRSSMQQQRMSAELRDEKLDSFKLNSVLWIMGQI